MSALARLGPRKSASTQGRQTRDRNVGKYIRESGGQDEIWLLLASLLLPLRPICLHPQRLRLTRSGGHATSPLFRGRGSQSGRGGQRILRAPATPFDWALQGFNCTVEFVALCDEERDDVFCWHKRLMLAQHR